MCAYEEENRIVPNVIIRPNLSSVSARAKEAKVKCQKQKKWTRTEHTKPQVDISKLSVPEDTMFDCNRVRQKGKKKQPTALTASLERHFSN